MARLPARVGLTHGAFLLSVLVGCSGATKDGPSSSSDGAGQAGAAAEPTGAGGNGAGTTSSVAGASSGATTNEGGLPAGGGDDQGGAAGGAAPISEDPAYASRVVSFEPGIGAGFNQDQLPGIVLGPPKGQGIQSGSLDVVSLGAGGEIVLAFGELGIVDGPGPDLVVFENAFWPGDDPTKVFYELGEVSVSEDGETWLTFACDSVGDGQGNFSGCAGVTPTLVYDADKLVPLDPEKSGGDAFDLADVGLKRARFVKIHDLETLPPGGMTTGFDLDAVAAIHAQ